MERSTHTAMLSYRESKDMRKQHTSAIPHGKNGCDLSTANPAVDRSRNVLRAYLGWESVQSPAGIIRVSPRQAETA